MLACVLVALWQGSLFPEPDKRVDFQPETARMVNLAEPLGQTLGVHVAVGENLRNEVLAVCAPNVTRKELAAKIAECLDADWRRDGTTLALERSKACEEQVRKREIDALAKLIRAKQGDMRAALAKQGEFTPAMAKVISERVAEKIKNDSFGNANDDEALARLAPMGRFAVKLFCSLRPQLLAEAQFSGRAVFRPKPNKRQKQLDIPKADIDALVKEQALFTEAMKNVDVASYEKPWRSIPYGMKGGLIEPDSDCMLQMSVSASWISGIISLIDGQGHSVSSAYLGMDLLERPHTPLEGPERSIDFGPETKEFIEVYRLGRQGKAPPLSDHLRSWMLRPDIHEPLGLGVTEALRTLAAADGKAIVMRVWDTLFFPAMNLTRGSTPGLGGFRALLASQNAEIDDEGKWRVIRPSLTFTFTRDDDDRASIAQWLNSADRGGPSFDSTLNVFAAHEEGFNSFTVMWYRMLHPEQSDESVHQVYGQWPNLLGATTPAQRTQLSDGKPIPISQMTPRAKAIIEESVFGLNGHIDVREPNGRSSRNPLLMEPTEVFPRELPQDGFMTAERKVDTVVFGLFDNPSPLRMGRIRRGAKDIGYQLAKQEAGDHLDPLRWPTKFAISQEESWSFRVRFTPLISAQGGFDDRFAPCKPVKFDDLPEELKRKARLWADYYKTHIQEPAPPISEGDYGEPPPGERH